MDLQWCRGRGRAAVVVHLSQLATKVLEAGVGQVDNRPRRSNQSPVVVLSDDLDSVFFDGSVHAVLVLGATAEKEARTAIGHRPGIRDAPDQLA
ncbi:hypothetical protein [Paenarthrobacter nicotinovorans]|uniref:hypothetical protein n=1 Tax=Paenarthrobacter nicotinovorans TaxID=29320 RepID=UPI0007E85F25|nr:hypothetical protein [Paenarthrobacter nicotinovorans]